MDIKTLLNMAPWDWPEGTDTLLLGVLRDEEADESDRLIAADLAGDSTVINDDLAEALLIIVESGDESDDIRSRAAISLGPALENADLMGFDDPDDELISKRMFDNVKESLHHLFVQEGLPKTVRRMILEAAVRAPMPWQTKAILEADSSSDRDWRITAIFCMRFVRGFDERILEALESDDPLIHFHAVCAAGNQEVAAAWSHIKGLVESEETDKETRLAAIEAVVGLRPEEAAMVLDELIDHSDEEIVDTVQEALAMARGLAEFEDMDFDDLDEDEDEENEGYLH